MMSRIPKLLVMAICLVIAHVIAIVFLHGTPAGSFLADTVYLSGVLLAAISCLLTFRRTRLVARTFWLLTGSTFVLWTFAHLGGIYYEYFRRPYIQNPDLLTFIFFFAVTPLFLTLLLVP